MKYNKNSSTVTHLNTYKQYDKTSADSTPEERDPRGRKKVAPNRLAVSLGNEEYEYLRTWAAKTGMSLSGVMRLLVIQHMTGQVKSDINI